MMSRCRELGPERVELEDAMMVEPLMAHSIEVGAHSHRREREQSPQSQGTSAQSARLHTYR